MQFVFLPVIILLFLLSSEVHASPQNPDYYLELTCYKDFTTTHSMGVAHIPLDPNAPLPGPADLAALNPVRYQNLINLCSDGQYTIHPQMKIDVVPYFSSLPRSEGEACDDASQCTSGFCDTNLGNCVPFAITDGSAGGNGTSTQ